MLIGTLTIMWTGVIIEFLNLVLLDLISLDAGLMFSDTLTCLDAAKVKCCQKQTSYEEFHGKVVRPASNASNSELAGSSWS